MPKKSKKKIGALSILGWVIGLILIFAGLGVLSSKFAGMSIVYFLTALFIFPPGYRLISNTFNIELSVTARIVIAFLISVGLGFIVILISAGSFS